MLDKICECCGIKFTLPNLHKKNTKRRFCGSLCSRRWIANNRSDNWKKKNSESKLGEKNPMFGIKQVNSNSLANLTSKYWCGKSQSEESNKKRSAKLIGKVVSAETRQKISKANTKWIPDDPIYKQFKNYRRRVNYWTNKNDLTKLENYANREKFNYHLDHKFSIIEGFKLGVPPQIVGSIYNLEFIPFKDNIKKGTKCSISLEKLNELFAAID